MTRASTLTTRAAAESRLPRSLVHSGLGTSRYVIVHITGTVFPATAGLLLFGWRALGVMFVVVMSALAATAAWRRIGSRGAQLDPMHAIWLAGLLSLTLPSHLFRGNDPGLEQLMVWPVLVVAGVVLVMIMWLLAAVGAGRVHPVVFAHVVLLILFGQLMVPKDALQWGRVFWGDVLDSAPVQGTKVRPWSAAEPLEMHDAIQTDPAALILGQFTSPWGGRLVDRQRVTPDALLRSWMPPLEDLLTGGQPAPVGLGSAICVIVGGLYLLYRGVIDARVPLLMIVTAWVGMLVLPIPVVGPDHQVHWWWLAARSPDVGWPLGVTLVNYELLAGPLLFTAFFLASAPMVRPIARRARVVYAILLGLLTAVMQLYVSVMVGAYLAVFIGALLAPTIDRWFKPRTLV